MGEPDFFAEFDVLLEGSTGVGRYARGTFLGKGGSGYCFELIAGNKSKYAGKFVENKTDVDRPRVRHEQVFHEGLQHHNVVGLKEVIKNDSWACFVMELCSRGSLYDRFLKKNSAVSEHNARSFMRQLLSAVRYLHKHGIIHRDIKPENLFLDENFNLKLGDFGFATWVRSRKRVGETSTPYYTPPEIFKGHGYGYKVDIWSAGCVLYDLLVGKSAFFSKSDADIERKVLERKPRLPRRLTRPAKDLISWMLHKDPSCRPTLDQVLKHEFMK